MGVVLSGSRNAGALGLAAIGEAGGLTIAQAPESAAHETMPATAIATGVVDRVLTPARIAGDLEVHGEHLRRLASDDRERKLRREIESDAKRVVKVLERRTQHDFLQYKSSTLVRRIRRRMQVQRIATADEYVQRLEDDETECRALNRELLIGVTSFFRDPSAFAALAEQVLSELIPRASASHPIRIWVPGCATGEEAYSIAMICLEHMPERTRRPAQVVQIFGTDINPRALAVARRGVYSEASARSVDKQRRKRFFVRRGNKYHVSKTLRSLCVFSPHNLITDPAYSSIDLISCRNVLIYLEPELQKKLFLRLHQALRRRGYLFLGTSETTAQHGTLFTGVDATHRIWRRSAVSAQLAAPRSAAPPRPLRDELNPTDLAVGILLDEFAPQWAVVNEEARIVALSAGAEKYLQVTGGTFHNNIVMMARTGLRAALRTALSEAREHERRVDRGDVSLVVPGGVQRLVLTVRPVTLAGRDANLHLVVFRELGGIVDREHALQAAEGSEAEAVVRQLRRELYTTREDLEKSIGKLETANEELNRSNEELLGMNEELHTANEELEASRQEVERANSALAQAKADLENLLRSTAIATLFLDDSLNIQRFTPAVTDIYNIRESDVGRPIWHLTHHAKYMPELPDVAAVLRDDTPIEQLVETRNGRAFVRRVLPYRTHEGKPEGLVVTFSDVTAMQGIQRQLRAATDRLEVAWHAAQGGVYEHDVQLDELTFHTQQWAQILGYDVHELPKNERFRDWLYERASPSEPRCAPTGPCGRGFRGARARRRWRLDCVGSRASGSGCWPPRKWLSTTPRVASCASWA